MQPVMPEHNVVRIAGPTERRSFHAAEPGSPALPAVKVPETRPTPEQIAEAIATANKALKSVSSSVEFSLDQGTGKTVIRIIDSSNHQVIRQVPSEEMLAIARAVDRLQGLLLRQDA
jgi:flagellar protein FlaG